MPAPAARRRSARSRLARQVMVLGLVLVAVALTLAYPLRTYLDRRADLADALAHEQQLQAQRHALEAQLDALNDPAYIKVEARSRLQYVSPGDVVYRIVAPELEKQEPATDSEPEPEPEPWYALMWATLTEPVPDTGPAGR